MATTEDKIFRINHCLCQFSNNGAYLAIAFQTNLIIKDAKTLDICRSFVFADVIQYIEWSSNSEYILCANITKAVVQVYSIHYPQWKCKLTEGSAGLQSVTWALDSKCILTVADFNIQISIWNLEDQTVSYIQNVKTSAFDKLHFSPSGKRLAVIITDEAQDTVEIFKTNNWKISRKLICDRLRSIDGICWSPNDELLCIWCSSTAEPRLIVYSTVWEKPITTFSPVETTRSSEYNCEKELKGIESVEWNSSGQLLAVIGFNEVVLLLNYVTWKPLSQLYLDPVIRESNYLTKVYKECGDSEKILHARFASCEERVLHEIHERPICIEIGEKNGYMDNFSIAKFKVFGFSACGQYLALTHELYPTTLWIWDICTDYLDYMLLENPISAVRWSPVHPRMLVFSECTRVYEWTRKGASSVAMSKTMSVVDGRWHPEGERVVLCGYNKAMVCEVPTRF